MHLNLKKINTDSEEINNEAIKERRIEKGMENKEDNSGLKKEDAGSLKETFKQKMYDSKKASNGKEPNQNTAAGKDLGRECKKWGINLLFFKDMIKNMGNRGWMLIVAIAAIILIAAFIVNIDRMVPLSSAKQFASDDAIVFVNSAPITVGELDSEMSHLPAMYQQLMDQLSLKKTVLEQLIVKKILLQEAENKGYTVSDKEVSEKIKSMYTEMGLTEEQFLDRINEDGLTIEKVNSLYRDQFIISKLLDEELAVEVSEDSIKKYYDENAEMLAKVHASHVLVCYNGTQNCEKDRTEEAALNIIGVVAQKIKDGADFAELAKEYSDCPSGPRGGDLGWFSRGQMIKEFEEAAFALEKNEVSAPLKTVFGYHIVKLHDKKTSFEELKSDIAETLKKEQQQEKMEGFIGSLKAKAVIEHKIKIEELVSAADFKKGGTDIPTGLTTIDPEKKIEEPIDNAGITTFKKIGGDVCAVDGKPVIRMFTTTWCPHCEWVKKTFDSLMKDLMADGKVVAYHWEIDTGDNTLTEEIEKEVPAEEMAVFKEFNPGSSIPTYIFGCKYYRIGNGHEGDDDLDAEFAEFNAVIGDLMQ